MDLTKLPASSIVIYSKYRYNSQPLDPKSRRIGVQVTLLFFTSFPRSGEKLQESLTNTINMVILR
jgi:hypothetical protein